MDDLLAYAVDPSDPLAQALAGAIAHGPARGARPGSPIPGIDADGFANLLAAHFPGAEPPRASADGCRSLPLDEFDDLLALLREHRSSPGPSGEWLACVIAAGCLGNNHLWQDLGLPDRQALSRLLRDHFRPLHDLNSGNMKWKKFFYRQLCQRAGVPVCKAPSCAVCSDYARCFAPEDGPH